jgi:hypothetical protein
MAAVRQLYNRELTIDLRRPSGWREGLISIATRKAQQTVYSYIFVCYREKGGNEAASKKEYDLISAMPCLNPTAACGASKHCGVRGVFLSSRTTAA